MKHFLIVSYSAAEIKKKRYYYPNLITVGGAAGVMSYIIKNKSEKQQSPLPSLCT